MPELVFKEEMEKPIPPPPDMVPIDLCELRDKLAKDIEETTGLSPEEALKEANKKINERIQGAEISAEKVNELITESLHLIKFVELKMGNKHPFQQNTLNFYKGLKQDVIKLTPDQPIREFNDKYNFTQVETTAEMLKNCLKNFEGFQV